MKNLWRNNSLSIVMLSLFVVFTVAQSLVGWQVYNQEQETHQQATVGYVSYLGQGHFVEAFFENWESEFLQMWFYVMLTAFLVQRGSAESKKPGEGSLGQHKASNQSPLPVRRGGLAKKIYSSSLSIAFFILFMFSFLMHAVGGASAHCQESQAHGEACISIFEYMTTAQFWFESFQNWQSEFLAVAAIVVLTIYLRQDGSPESKLVNAPHAQTGT
jgi:hypothetical protein